MIWCIYCCLHHYFDILKMLSLSFCQKTVQKKFRSYFLHFYFVRWAIFILWRIPYMYYVVVVIRIKLETSWRVIKPSLSFQYDYCMTWVFIVNIKPTPPSAKGKIGSNSGGFYFQNYIIAKHKINKGQLCYM